ncbi:hypothetical protein GCM10009557_32760 [Virgisporangium ochraceum]|uniref:Uncharacterized protein n=1 Tax=Virgisporangium ochraceum TaxID=65505 RepID=A0A8J3ZTW7_9ACTN|nr:hypothetical protein Voc01_039200 [Virgisporangium ochraceum]
MKSSFATNPPTGENTNDQIGSHCHQTSRPTPAMAATTATAVTHFFMRTTLGRKASTVVVLGHVSDTHPRVYPLRAVSGPVTRRSSGSVDAMIARDARRPAATIT